MSNFKPSQRKYYKVQKGRLSGVHVRKNYIAHGLYGLITQERGYVREFHLETLRIVLTRAVRGLGKYWLPIFPQHSLTRKPLGVRMGKGKGAISDWVCRVRPGIQLAGLSGLVPEVALPLLRSLGKKMPVRCVVVTKYLNLYDSEKSLSRNIIPNSYGQKYSRRKFVINRRWCSKLSSNENATKIASHEILGVRPLKSNILVSPTSFNKRILKLVMISIKHADSNCHVNLLTEMLISLRVWLSEYLDPTGFNSSSLWSREWASRVVFILSTKLEKRSTHNRLARLRYYFNQANKKFVPMVEKRKIIQFLLRWSQVMQNKDKHISFSLNSVSVKSLDILACMIPWYRMLSHPRRYTLFRVWIDNVFLLSFDNLTQLYSYCAGELKSKDMLHLLTLLNSWSSDVDGARCLFPTVSNVNSFIINQSDLVTHLLNVKDKKSAIYWGIEHTSVASPLQHLFISSVLQNNFTSVTLKKIPILFPYRLRQNQPEAYLNVCIDLKSVSFNWLPKSLQLFWQIPRSLSVVQDIVFNRSYNNIAADVDSYLNSNYLQHSIVNDKLQYERVYTARIVAYDFIDETFTVSLTPKYCGNIPLSLFSSVMPGLSPWSLLHRFCLVKLRDKSLLSNVLEDSFKADLAFDKVNKNLLESTKIRSEENSFKHTFVWLNDAKPKPKSMQQSDSVTDNELHWERYSQMVLGLISRGKKKPYILNDNQELALINPAKICIGFYRRYLVEQLL